MSIPDEVKVEELRQKWGRIEKMESVPKGYEGEIWLRRMTKFDARKYHQRKQDEPMLCSEQTAYDLIVYPEDAERNTLLDDYPMFCVHIENTAVLSAGLATESAKKG